MIAGENGILSTNLHGSLQGFGLPCDRGEFRGCYRLGVVLGVVLAGFFGVMRGVVEMTLSDVGMVPGLLMITPFMVLGCGQVVFRRVFMVFCRLSMMLDGFLRHGLCSLRLRSVTRGVR
jgi:hypothetical protein